MQREKKLFPVITSWSYIGNENQHVLRMTLEGFGSFTPAIELQEMINNLTSEEFENLWQAVQNSNDILK